MTFLILALTGCGVSKSEHETLKRKVVALEKRVRAMENGATRGGGPAKGAKVRQRRRKGRGSGQPRARGTVAVAGDAIGVFVASKRHRIPVPAEVREGTFEALAVFESGQQPVAIGPITIAPDKTTTIRCKRAAAKCTISEPE